MVKLEYRTLEKNEHETIDYCTINGDRVSLDTYCKVEAELKKAKAFDILAKREVSIWIIREKKTFAEYEYAQMFVKNRLTQEEWDFLKEVLE